MSTWNQESLGATNRYHRNLIFNPEVARGGAHRADYASADFVLNAQTIGWHVGSGLCGLGGPRFQPTVNAEMFQMIPGLRSIDFDRIGPGGWGSIGYSVRADAFVAGQRFLWGSDDIWVQRDRRQWIDRMGCSKSI